MKKKTRTLQEILIENEPSPPGPWELRAIQSEHCLSYIAWNSSSREALIIDPKDEDWDEYLAIQKELKDYLWIGVIDTHTHADHISCASQIAEAFHAPLIMHALAPSKRVHLRVSKLTSLPSHAGPVSLIPTPGHTQDSLTIAWGPFLFGGDTLLFADVGRDDLPGGDAEAHYESLQIIKKLTPPESILLPGHDHRGGRASSWATQLNLNSSLTQNREDFIRECSEFDAPAPQLFKKSLQENFK